MKMLVKILHKFAGRGNGTLQGTSFTIAQTTIRALTGELDHQE
jgi:hypothetical protein